MAGRVIKVLGIHGLGDHRDETWKPRWTKAIEASFPLIEGDVVKCEYLTYDDIFFNETELSGFEIAGALWKLSKSGISGFGRRDRGFLDKITHWVRKSAGYVVAWVEDDGFQAKTRKRLLDAIAEHKPDIIIAHSLGSLIAYNALSHTDVTNSAELSSAVNKLILVTIGAQIGNPFVIGNQQWVGWMRFQLLFGIIASTNTTACSPDQLFWRMLTIFSKPIHPLISRALQITLQTVTSLIPLRWIISGGQSATNARSKGRSLESRHCARSLLVSADHRGVHC